MKNVEERGYATILVISTGTDGKRYHMDLGVAQEKRWEKRASGKRSVALTVTA